MTDSNLQKCMYCANMVPPCKHPLWLFGLEGFRVLEVAGRPSKWSSTSRRRRSSWVVGGAGFALRAMIG